ncbi:hypothetical protein RJ639_015599 [Escallonia herrerae]|uniref:C2 domain-containing protein n=1 Tax=Escallonia herrerae TaxID=1293975 RepID=A0AA88VCU6_9ASTE|nr:hypothetical protein RJ639_015599 [Escallonia herrerae]
MHHSLLMLLSALKDIAFISFQALQNYHSKDRAKQDPIYLTVPLRGAQKKPMGILHVKIVQARNLLNKDFLGTSDPYVKLGLSGERLPSKKTFIKMNNLNLEWHEVFKFTVKDPQSQVLEVHVNNWEKVKIILIF